MANNRLYLVARPREDEPKCVLLAKGWPGGWQLWEPETLVERLELLLSCDTIATNSDGLGEPVFSIEDENSMASPVPEILRHG